MFFSELNRFYLGRQSEGAGLLERPRPRAEDLDTEVHCKIYTQTQFLLRKVLWALHLVALYKLESEFRNMYKCNDWCQILVFFCVYSQSRGSELVRCFLNCSFRSLLTPISWNMRCSLDVYSKPHACCTRRKKKKHSA